MNMKMGVVIGGPAIAAVVIAMGLAWATNLAAETAAPGREVLAQRCSEGGPGPGEQPCPSGN